MHTEHGIDHNVISLALAHFANDDRQTVTLPGGVGRAFTYKTNGPVATIGVTGPSGSIAQYTYAYDDVLNVDSITDADGLHDFGYDALNRLTGSTRPSGIGVPNETYVYDRTGNREDPGNAALYSYDGNNRISASPGLSYSFDADGNMLSRTDGAAFTHDASNRMLSYSKGATSASYLYDTFGRRIRKTANGAAAAEAADSAAETAGAADESAFAAMAFPEAAADSDTIAADIESMSAGSDVTRLLLVSGATSVRLSAERLK